MVWLHCKRMFWVVWTYKFLISFSHAKITNNPSCIKYFFLIRIRVIKIFLKKHRCQIPISDTSFKDLLLKDEHKKVYYQLFRYLLCSTEIMIFILQDRVFFESHATFATLSDKKNDLFYRIYVMIRNITLHISKYKSLEDKKR